MRSRVYAIFDSKIGAYMPPFTMQSKGAAIRGFSDAVNDSAKRSNLTDHPEDFTLFELGEWDDEDASFKLHAAKVSIGTALEFKKVSDNTVSIPKRA